MSTSIFSVGTAGTHQASLRVEDGQWFERKKDELGHWRKWTKRLSRPEHSWYNPRNGLARLPKIEDDKKK